MTHLSDLTLELLLAQEPVPPGTEFHLHACDECWARWEALHRHEGRAAPVRQVAAPANRSWLPWSLAGAAGLLAAGLLLQTGPRETSVEETRQLRDEVQVLKQELEQLREQAPARSTPKALPSAPPLVIDGSPPPPAEEAPEGDTPTPGKPSVSELRERAEGPASDAILDAVDDLALRIDLSDEDADDVEELLHDELDETWQIKEDVEQGLVSEPDAWSEWKALRKDTDEKLVALLGAEATKELRQALDADAKGSSKD